MGVGGVCVLMFYSLESTLCTAPAHHLCIHNCNTRACALLGVSLQCHLDLLQVAGQSGENEKFKQFLSCASQDCAATYK